MKKLLTLIASGILYAGVASAQQYGNTFKADNAMDVPALAKVMTQVAKMDKVVVKGKITQVCQAAGCWIKLKNEAGDDVFVKFKEIDGKHELTVPKNIAGKTATVYGTASKKTISVKQQKHFAEDAGASNAEIAKITQDKQQLRIDATGVVVN
jgi:hypothetical protein